MRVERAKVEQACGERLQAYAAVNSEFPLCLRCLGRTLGRVGHGLSNARRGAVVARATAWRPTDRTCSWCRGLLYRIDGLAAEALELAAEHEFTSFEVGTRVFERTRAVERRLEELGFAGVLEPIQREVNREVGKRIEARCGRPCMHRNPDLRVRIDPFHRRLRLDWKPLWIAGRYRKLARGLSQTAWRRSRAGANPGESVEELIGVPALALTGAECAVLHGAGREDVDVRMLASGRPFVLELREPRRRSIDLGALERSLAEETRVQVRELRWAARAEIAELKAGGWLKSYAARVAIAGEDPGPQAVREALQRMRQAPLEQRTPERVSHRRADRVRRRELHAARVLRLGEGRYALLLLASAGLYIKELIHGDEGRTHPSLAELLERECRCESLDVLAIHDDREGLGRFRRRWFSEPSGVQ